MQQNFIVISSNTATLPPVGVKLCIKPVIWILRKGRNIMNQEKIGKFIASCRKEQNLTQEQLAEKLGITFKAVSKWECGRSLPDPSIMMELCEILNISVSELFAAEKIKQEDRIKKSEETIIKLSELTRFKSMRYGIIGMAILFILLVLISTFKNQSPSGLVSMLCAYNAITFLLQYKQSKETAELIAGALFLLGTILNTVAFIFS